MDVEITNWRSPEKEVEKFLKDVCEILDASANRIIFNHNGPKEKAGTKYSNRYCMDELGFTEADVINVIRALTLEDYVHTINYSDGSRFFVFCKYVKISQVYIKLRIRENKDGGIVVCVSFHFAEHEITTFPYKRRKK